MTSMTNLSVLLSDDKRNPQLMPVSPVEARMRYVQDWKDWVHRGKAGRPPQSPDYGIMLWEVTEDIAAIEVAMRLETGFSSWQYFDPQYYEPMMATRQLAVTFAKDPDDEARIFTEYYMKRTGITPNESHKKARRKENGTSVERNVHRAGQRCPDPDGPDQRDAFPEHPPQPEV